MAEFTQTGVPRPAFGDNRAPVGSGSNMPYGTKALVRIRPNMYFAMGQ
jgi:hypothetical protein